MRILERNGVVTAIVDGEVVDHWARERVLAERALAEGSGAPPSVEPNEASARRIARELDARLATWIVLEESALGPGLIPPAGPSTRGPQLPKPNERFARLTPEQRVQHSRQRRHGIIMERQETVRAAGNAED